MTEQQPEVETQLAKPPSEEQANVSHSEQNRNFPKEDDE